MLPLEYVCLIEQDNRGRGEKRKGDEKASSTAESAVQSFLIFKPFPSLVPYRALGSSALVKA